jgi:hypothetical protein
VAWAYARHYWRQVRVVEKARTRVTVVYRLAIGGGIRRQVLQAFNLKTEKPTPRFGVLRTKTVPPPSLEEVGL